MYTQIKNILFRFIPTRLIEKYEFTIRKFISLFYMGKSVKCNVCEKSFSDFIRIPNGDTLCPRCGSLDRHRRLWQIIQKEICFKPDDRILDFSPSRMLMKKLKVSYPNYLSTNYLKTSLADRNYDITALAEPSNTFDRIICYHVLEHIENDRIAIGELYRVLKTGGIAIIQTPFKEGKLYENPDIVTEKERLIHFGQEDHVRLYSVEGLKERLENAGFQVKILTYSEDPHNFYGFRPKEVVLLASK